MFYGYPPISGYIPGTLPHIPGYTGTGLTGIPGSCTSNFCNVSPTTPITSFDLFKSGYVYP
jgi:hypothetical protein